LRKKRGVGVEREDEARWRGNVVGREGGREGEREEGRKGGREGGGVGSS
jgi:hypothetical protein